MCKLLTMNFNVKEVIMNAIYIENEYKILDFEVFKYLRIFAQRKDAKQWCKDNNVNPVRIIKARTRFQESYVLDMGRNHFLTGGPYCEKLNCS